jgi:hypothetical protein
LSDVVDKYFGFVLLSWLLYAENAEIAELSARRYIQRHGIRFTSTWCGVYYNDLLNSPGSKKSEWDIGLELIGINIQSFDRLSVNMHF